MENLQEKAEFLRSRYTAILTELDEHAPRLWGKMNVRQMIEHMSDYVRIANGRTPVEVVTPAEHVPRAQAFLETEKGFRENTPNQLMADEPPAERHATKAAAIAELQAEIDHFFSVFAAQPDKTINNPFFGVLGYRHQVQLLHKHSTHHLRQFAAPTV
jgi:hypothetical protein